MNDTKYLWILLFIFPLPVLAQTSKLQRQLEQSEYLTYTMKPDSADAGLTRWLRKKPSLSQELELASDFGSLRNTGPGIIQVSRTFSHSGKGSILLQTPASLAVKNPTNRSYATAELIRPLDRENLEQYNRFSVWLYSDATGFYSVFIGCTLFNEGEKPMPAPGRFEGQHFETVTPGKWHRIIWEMPDLYRDAVTGFGVNIMLAGSPVGASDQLKLYVDDMRIEKVEAENSRGFDLRKNSIAYSHSGYKTGARKQALIRNSSNTKFQLVNLNGKTVFSGEGKKLDNDFIELDFTDYNTPGYYAIKAGNISSKPFAIGDEAYLATAWHTLNFFFAERCGFDQPGIHQECHKDATCIHPDGRTLPINGGWHDAADLTQGVGNTSKGGIAMLELASAVKDKQPALYKRLLEEGRWGLNWVMQTRFGDGYRLAGLIMSIWTDNINGTKDDMQAKARNNPSDNFIAATYCALAAPMYANADPVFARWCRKSAIEDFAFANEMLSAAITDKNETELYAKAAVSAMYLYRLTGEQSYLDIAVRYADIVMQCQELTRRKEWSMPLHGFFYESREKKRILEYFHRSDEQMMVQALTMLLKDAPAHPRAAKWLASCKAYADYLRETAGVIQPYNILPGAIYELDNAEFAGIYHEGARVGMPSMEEYNAQVKNGIHLGGKFYLRRFPVAYQFRGFHAILIAKAKAALLLSTLLKDQQLKDIGTRQLEYIIGYNPFAMSTIYGDGYDYPLLYGAHAGNVVGAVPVGIETFENDDEPYMPMQVNATYKEIWTHTTAGVISLLAELF